VSALVGVGDRVTVFVRDAWRRGRIWKIGRGGLSFHVGVRVPRTGRIHSHRVWREDAKAAEFVPPRTLGGRAPRSIEVPAPELLDILQGLKKR
jgi:hypothetical protein